MKLSISQPAADAFKTLRLTLSNHDLAACVQQLNVDIERSLDTPIAVLRAIRKTEFDAKVRTASVHLPSGEVRFNAEFFAMWVHSPEDLAFIMLHERGHVVLNYVSNTIGVTGFEEDAVINPPWIRFTGSDLPTRLYLSTCERAPWLLLLQNDRVLTENRLFSLGAAQSARYYNEVRYWYIRAYSNYPSSRDQRSVIMRQIREWREDLMLRLKQHEPQMPEVPDAGSVTTTVAPLGHDPLPDQIPSTASNTEVQDKPDPTISFRLNQAPAELGITEVDALVSDVIIPKAPPVGRGMALTTVLAAAMGTPDGGVYYHTSIPIHIAASDVAMLARGGLPLEWMHESCVPDAHSSLYVDFSDSMRPYWPLALAVGKVLRHKIRDMYAFASVLQRFETHDDGVSVGGGTALDPVLDTMESSTSSVVVWVTDLEFYPTLVTAATRLNMLLGRFVRRLVVCYPTKTPSLEVDAQKSKIMEQYFRGLTPRASACITIILVSADGSAS